MSTTGPPTALADALRDRYRIERELGRGGMAAVHQRPPPTVTAALRARASTPASHKPGGDDISLTLEF